MADPGEGPPPLICRLNWGPKGWKKFFGGWASPLSQGLDDPPPPPPPPHPKVWTCHCIWTGEGCSCRCVGYHNIIIIVPSNLDRDDGMDIARLVFDRLLSPLWLPRCPGGICPITPRGPIDKMPRLKNYVNKVIKLKNENVEMRPYTSVHF